MITAHATNSSSSKLVSAFPVGRPLPLAPSLSSSLWKHHSLLVNSLDSGLLGGKSVTQ